MPHLKGNEKVLRETQTLHCIMVTITSVPNRLQLFGSCSKVEPKSFAPWQTPFLGARDGQNLISWRWSVPLPTNPVW